MRHEVEGRGRRRFFFQFSFRIVFRTRKLPTFQKFGFPHTVDQNFSVRAQTQRAKTQESQTMINNKNLTGLRWNSNTGTKDISAQLMKRTTAVRT